jgi:hypothetical protein
MIIEVTAEDIALLVSHTRESENWDLPDAAGARDLPRTLEMLRHLHRWHEIHYEAIENPAQPEGPAHAPEYSFRAYPFRYRVPDKRSPAFAAQLLRGLVSPVPLAVCVGDKIMVESTSHLCVDLLRQPSKPFRESLDLSDTLLILLQNRSALYSEETEVRQLPNV